jgi:fission process protein 1
MTESPSSAGKHPVDGASSSSSSSGIVHHDRHKHHTKKEPEYNVFRDSPIRYLGYANEVGESFRYQFPMGVVPSYVIAFGYCLADALASGKKAYDNSNNYTNSTRSNNDSGGIPSKSLPSSTTTTTMMTGTTVHSAVIQAALDTLIWQSLASVMIPGATINAIVKASRWAVTAAAASSRRPLPSMVMTWVPTAVGLGSIPLIIHPIDSAVDWFMESTFRQFVK